MKDYPRLPESELDIMLVIWDLGDQAAAPAILERLERPLTASALHSYLKRLEDKGYLTCTKEGKTNRYTPLVSREEYQRQEGTPPYTTGARWTSRMWRSCGPIWRSWRERRDSKWRRCFCGWAGSL